MAQKHVMKYPASILSDTGFGLFVSCIIIGCTGWFMELCIYYLQLNRIYDCGFLIMPWCPIYAVGILFVLFVINTFFRSKPSFFVYALISAFCATLLEGVSGVLFHRINLTLWNYSSWPLSNRYVYLPASIGWGIGGAVFLLYIYPYISKIAAGVSPTARKRFVTIFLSIVLLDYLVSFIIILQNGGYLPLY